jgi:hypothetical protein
MIIKTASSEYDVSNGKPLLVSNNSINQRYISRGFLSACPTTSGEIIWAETDDIWVHFVVGGIKRNHVSETSSFVLFNSGKTQSLAIGLHEFAGDEIGVYTSHPITYKNLKGILDKCTIMTNKLYTFDIHFNNGQCEIFVNGDLKHKSSGWTTPDRIVLNDPNGRHGGAIISEIIIADEPTFDFHLTDYVDIDKDVSFRKADEMTSVNTKLKTKLGSHKIEAVTLSTDVDIEDNSLVNAVEIEFMGEKSSINGTGKYQIIKNDISSVDEIKNIEFKITSRG